ncbi:hypothetical protein TNCT_430471 [Trichonephila clavata]|uniref:Uncharacterized protein n=1 Tax=Trichonephila clavata TaxID=2740835 RepID=A0A8X6GEK0_TRICU|nr:hypothetical protein TNCT_430471 [Trichonephila clavata]
MCTHDGVFRCRYLCEPPDIKFNDRVWAINKEHAKQHESRRHGVLLKSTGEVLIDNTGSFISLVVKCVLLLRPSRSLVVSDRICWRPETVGRCHFVETRCLMLSQRGQLRGSCD